MSESSAARARAEALLKRLANYPPDDWSTTTIEVVRALLAENERRTQDRDRLREALEELNAMVWGECPALLDEDRGGNARLALAIQSALSAPVPPCRGVAGTEADAETIGTGATDESSNYLASVRRGRV